MTIVRSLATFPTADEIQRFAVIRGAHDEYRYQLSRVWSYDEPHCLWIMLNPSTADASVDDATIRKCERFAYQWGHGGIIVVNLFAFRSRHPKALLATRDPVGPDNDFYIQEAAACTDRVVCGWGAMPFATARARKVPTMLQRRTHARSPQCLGLTVKGEPRHPLMLAYATELVDFAPQEH